MGVFEKTGTNLVFLVLIVFLILWSKCEVTANAYSADWGFFSIPKVGAPLADLPHVKWSRITGLHWQKLEQPPGSGRYNWQLLDGFVRGAQENGCNLVFVLKTGNDRATSDPRCYKVASSSKSSEKYLHSCPIVDEYKSHWQRLVSNIVERYDGDGRHDMPGLKRDFTLDIQIENEAGNPEYWSIHERKDGRQAAKQYIDLLRLSYEAKNLANPATKLILTGLDRPENLSRCSRNPTLPNCQSDFERRNIEFTKEILRYPQYFDAVDVHIFNYFRFDPDYIFDGLYWFKKEMRDNGYEKPIFSLEWTGAMMQMIRSGGHKKAFMNYFPYRHEFKDLEEAFTVYKKLALPQNRKYRAWFEKEQAKEFPKIFTTMLVNDIQRMIYVRFADYSGTGWDSVWWNWQGIVKYKGTRSNPIMVRKPAFHTYKILSEKLHGFTSYQILSQENGVYLYRFDFAHKSPVHVLWSEMSPTELNLSRFIRSPQVKVSHIVIALDGEDNPIRVAGGTVSTNAVPVSTTPVILD
jgi:hypothetical protein